MFSYIVSYRRGNPPISLCKESNQTSKSSYWSFDEMEKGVTADAHGNQFHGMSSSLFDIPFVNNTMKLVEGKVARALDFRGRAWINGGNSDFFCTDTFTIAMWAYRDKQGGVPTLMAKSAWPNYDGWWLCTKPETQYIDMAIAWGSGKCHIESGYEMPMDEWHHIAVSVDNINNRIVFYIDGKLFGSPHEDVPHWEINRNHDLFIGEYDGSGRWPWFGKIDEVYFFDGVLSEEEIKVLYEGT